MDSFLVPFISVITTVAIAFGTAFFKWLSSRFKQGEENARRSEDRFQGMFDAHEIKDQMRHEENLNRFEKISVALARLGNGGHSGA